MSAIRTLLAGSIDYAGLFPPAGLDMPAAVRNYARYLTAPEAWALGRFVVPVSRLEEFEAVAVGHLQRTRSKWPWHLSVLAGADLEWDLNAITVFNRRQTNGDQSPALADTLEIKATSKAAIEEILGRVPRDLTVFIEVPIEPDPAELLGAIARRGGRAKLRTGGVTADAFPTTSDLLRFIRACVDERIAFKATAGLHHPLRAKYRLTYAADSPTGPMFGFLNLFLATAFIRAGLDGGNAARLLEEGDRESFEMDPQGIVWRGHILDLEALRLAREEGLTSFGSCSFTEPLSDLEELGLLPHRVQQP